MTDVVAAHTGIPIPGPLLLHVFEGESMAKKSLAKRMLLIVGRSAVSAIKEVKKDVKQAIKSKSKSKRMKRGKKK
jgi:hypothetical protein